MSKLKTTCSFDYVGLEDIKNSFEALEAKTSHGIDGISNKILKLLKNELSWPLRIIMEKCFKQARMPTMTKTARVIYLHKSGDKKDMGNYRPISLLPTISKLIEKVFTKKVTDHMVRNELWYENQFGFRPRRSTVHAVMSFVHKVESVLHQNKYCLAVFIDVKKAFNCLQPTILSKKLEAYGIKGKENDFIIDYLNNRNQFSDLDGTLSRQKDVQIGCPQGGIFSAIAYIIYNNDLPNATDFHCILYADDTTLIKGYNSLQEMEADANSELKKLDTWFTANRLTLNAKKTQYMVFCPKGKENKDIMLTLQGTPLTRVGNKFETKTAKFLGIQVDEKLQFETHTDNVIKKFNSSVFGLCQVKHMLPEKTKILIYNSLCKPILEYGQLIWLSKASKKQKLKLTQIQKRAIRSIGNTKYNAHTEPLIQSFGILKVDDMLTEKAIKLFADKYPPLISGDSHAQ